MRVSTLYNPIIWQDVLEVYTIPSDAHFPVVVTTPLQVPKCLESCTVYRALGSPTKTAIEQSNFPFFCLLTHPDGTRHDGDESLDSLSFGPLIAGVARLLFQDRRAFSDLLASLFLDRPD